jgi:hypothetical protein
MIHGRFQEMWLGLYSSSEVGEFTTFWFEFANGWRLHRWGDQQYYFLVNALFSRDAQATLRAGRSDLVCTWGHKENNSKCILA